MYEHLHTLLLRVNVSRKNTTSRDQTSCYIGARQGAKSAWAVEYTDFISKEG